jgi:hypothetical protein
VRIPQALAVSFRYGSALQVEKPCAYASWGASDGCRPKLHRWPFSLPCSVALCRLLVPPSSTEYAQQYRRLQPLPAAGQCLRELSMPCDCGPQARGRFNCGLPQSLQPDKSLDEAMLRRTSVECKHFLFLNSRFSPMFAAQKCDLSKKAHLNLGF